MSIIERILQRARGKGLYDLYPELAERVPILRITSDGELDSENDFRRHANKYSVHMWVQKAVNVLANNIAPLPVRVAQGDDNETKYLGDHPISVLLDNPNPEMSAEDLWRQWTVDQMLGGEMGIEVSRGAGNRQPVELWPRQPDIFYINPADKRYRRVANYKIDDGEGDPYLLTPEEFIHIKFYNPLQPFRGLSPMTAIRYSIAIDQLAQAWTRLFFANSARPDYAVIAPTGITKTERDELENMLSRKFGGDNAHKPIILEQGVTDIKTFSFAPKDLAWVEQRQFSRDEIGAVFGVPDEIMGYGRDTYENFATAETVLWTLTIVPLCGLRDGTLTRFFRKTGLLKPGQRIQTDFRNVPQLQEDVTGKIEQLVKLAQQGYPINILNDWLGLGLPVVQGGDVGYLPFGMVPIGTPRPTQSSQPPPPKALTRKTKAPEYGSIEHQMVWKQAQDRIEDKIGDMQRELKKFIQRQQLDVIQALRDDKTFGRGKFVKNPDKIPNPEQLFNLANEIKAFMDAFFSLVFGAVVLVGQDEASVYDIDFDNQDPETIAYTRQILEVVSEKTNETTWLGLVDVFQAAEAEGVGIVEIQDRLNIFFGERKSDWQTERIARTTMTGASNLGQQEAWKQTDVVKRKVWISALIPGRTRDAHADAHGQTVGIREMFTVGGEMLAHPGDPSGSPGNIINCLCTMTAEVED